MFRGSNPIVVFFIGSTPYSCIFKPGARFGGPGIGARARDSGPGPFARGPGPGLQSHPPIYPNLARPNLAPNRPRGPGLGPPSPGPGMARGPGPGPWAPGPGPGPWAPGPGRGGRLFFFPGNGLFGVPRGRNTLLPLGNLISFRTVCLRARGSVIGPISGGYFDFRPPLKSRSPPALKSRSPRGPVSHSIYF